MVHSIFCDCLTAFGGNQLPADSHSACTFMHFHALRLHACTHCGSQVAADCHWIHSNCDKNFAGRRSLDNLYGHFNVDAVLKRPQLSPTQPGGLDSKTVSVSVPVHGCPDLQARWRPQYLIRVWGLQGPGFDFRPEEVQNQRLRIRAITRVQLRMQVSQNRTGPQLASWGAVKTLAWHSF